MVRGGSVGREARFQRTEAESLQRQARIPELLARRLSGSTVFRGSRPADADPRLRPWYAEAKASRRQEWSETYILYGSKGEPELPGITCATPVVGEDGTFQGVLAAGFDVIGLSTYLRSLTVGSNGYAFVVECRDDGTRRVVAHKEPKLLVRRSKPRPGKHPAGSGTDGRAGTRADRGAGRSQGSRVPRPDPERAGSLEDPRDHADHVRARGRSLPWRVLLPLEPRDAGLGDLPRHARERRSGPGLREQPRDGRDRRLDPRGGDRDRSVRRGAGRAAARTDRERDRGNGADPASASARGAFDRQGG